MPPATGPLPILAHREDIARAVERSGCLVLAAPPGTGKSTQVPRYLLSRPGRIVVLQPRRIAARNLALRVAEEMGEPVGATVGYQVRFEGKAGAATRILYQTYGVFFQQMQSDPLLEGVGAVLLDEFHERTLEADATLAWIKRLRGTARPDLALVVMSATLELEGLKAYLAPAGSAAAETVEVAAETFPVEIAHQPPVAQEPLPQQAARALKRLLAQGLSGSVLVFMPGQGEIRRTLEALDPICRPQGLGLYELHGAMDAESQQRALRAPLSGACVIVATNVAETSLTIPGITAVIDSGQARIAAYSPQRDLNTLYLGSISLQNARQRAGRAGRTAPGVCIRLWSQDRERGMAPALDPEALRVEPTALALSLHALLDRFGRLRRDAPPADDLLVPWLTPPAPALWDRAEAQLARIGAVIPRAAEPGRGNLQDTQAAGGSRITPLGRALARFPAHPVLARVLLDARRAGVGPQAAAMAAILESQSRRAKGASSDLFALGLDLSADEDARRFDRETREAYRQLLRLLDKAPPDLGAAGPPPRAEGAGGARPTLQQEEAALRAAATRCWIVPFQDRIAARVENGNSFVLADGRRATAEPGAVPPETGAILALELHETGGTNQGRQVGVPMLLPLDPAWIDAAFPGECRWAKAGGWDAARGRVAQEERFLFRGLALARRPLREGAQDPEEAERVLVEKLIAGEIDPPGMDDEARQLILRMKLAAAHYPEYGIPKLDEEDWRLIYHELCAGKSSLRELEGASLTRALREYLGASLGAFLDKAAPVSLKLPGGRMGRLTYAENGPPELSARLGDFIGMEGRTHILDGKVEVIYDILAPNYRTVQKTGDLTGFWKNTYPEVKKELKRRYPRHPWP